MTLAILEREYPGEAAWENFASAIRSMQNSNGRRVVHPLESCDEQMALVMNAIMGDHASSWMTSPCKALEMRTPLEVLQTERAGVQIVRHLLMRMP